MHGPLEAGQGNHLGDSTFGRSLAPVFPDTGAFANGSVTLQRLIGLKLGRTPEILRGIPSDLEARNDANVRPDPLNRTFSSKYFGRPNMAHTEDSGVAR